ncbi:MAG: hypothetical protein ACRDTG_32535 [Pseudonocardiaceae bacterium]
MSSIDDCTNGAERTRAFPNTVEERKRAVRLVLTYAQDADDAHELCATLGLHPREGRRQTIPRLP